MSAPVTFRDPTGKIPWPFILLAGGEKAGKSWAAINASASPLVGMAYYIEVGEGDADQYGRIPGVRYKIAQHDGSVRGILAACEAAVAQPRLRPDLPNLIILDSKTELWDLITAEQQEVANKRRKKEDAQITMDQWNAAKKRWRRILNVLRNHDGPVIVTARLEQVTIMRDGQPTTEKEWKIRAEKNLGFEVSGIVQLPTFGEAYLTGVRTPVLPMTPGEITKLPADWTMDWLWRQLGLDDAENIGTREYVEPNPNAYADAVGVNPALAAQAIIEKAALATDSATLAALYAEADDADLLNFDVTLDGRSGPLVHALRALNARMAAATNPVAPTAPAAPVEQAPAPVPTAAPQAPAPAPVAAAPVAAQPQGGVAVATAPTFTPAPAEETRAAKARRFALDEAGYQADVLGVDRAEYLGQIEPGATADKIKASALQRFLIPAREQVVAALRTQGRATEAEAYAGIGIAFPMNLAQVFGAE